jgi:hypothetical protein
MNDIEVLATRSIVDPARGRVHALALPGTTIAEMVDRSLPGAPLDRVTVTIAKGQRFATVPRHKWNRIRPRGGAKVLIQVTPGQNMRAVLSILVTVAAVAAAAYFAPFLAPTLIGAFGFTAATATNVAFGLIAGAATIAGQVLINALVPLQPTGQRKDSPAYSIQGWQNVANPNGPVPLNLGNSRVAPPYAASPYTEVVGDDMYVIALFCFGYGPNAITEHKFGDTDIDKFEDVTIEVREGYDTDLPITLYPEQVLQEPLSITLVNTEDDGPVPVSRFTANDTYASSVDFSLPGGLFDSDSDGNTHPHEVDLQIRYRLNGTGAWTTESVFTIHREETQAFFVNHRWTYPGRGRYEVEVTRVSKEKGSTKSSRIDWIAFRSFRPEYPISFAKPLTLVAIKVKASKQLNGILDNYNAVASRVAPDWDSGTQTWITRETRSPAAAYRYLLQGPAIARPLTDDQIDLDGLAAWAEFCAPRNLCYDRFHDYDSSLLEVMTAVCATGRATPHDKGDKWGVAIDQIQTIITDHISARNSWGSQGETKYLKLPDAWRIRFRDRLNGFVETERVVLRPDFAGTVDDVDVTESIDMPGVTDPGTIWVEGRRRWYEVKYRPHTYQAVQNFEALRITRNDLVAYHMDWLDEETSSARVTSVDGSAIGLDDTVTMEAGSLYAMRFRKDTGESLLRTLQTDAGTMDLVNLMGSGDLPAVGDMAFFGPATRVTRECIVKSVQRGENSTHLITLVDAAPEIQTLADAEIAPAWDGRFGEIIGTGSTPPATPVFSKVITDLTGNVIVVLHPGSSTIYVASYHLQHRLQGAGSWSTVSVDSTGSASLASYTAGDIIELQAEAVGLTGLTSGYGAIKTFTVGATSIDAIAANSSGELLGTSSGEFIGT